MAEIRTFIAVKVEDTILARLRAVQQHLRTAGVQVAWVPAEGMHLTLKFLGNVAESRLPEITRALQLAANTLSPFHLSVVSVGGFPTPARLRVVWAGIGDGAGALCALAEAVDTQLVACGFPREDRPFTPHITLGRVKSPAGGSRLAELLGEHREETYGEMAVSEIHLIRSNLSPTGARYTVLQVVPLGCRQSPQ